MRRVLEVLSKRPFADALQTSVIAPLGLRRSAFLPTPLIAPNRDGVAYGTIGVHLVFKRPRTGAPEA